MMLSVNGSQVFVHTGARPLQPGLPSIVFVHGAANDHSVFALQSRYFAHRGRNVLAVDLPGHGRSGGSPLESVEQLADWLPALLDAAGIARASLVGHSMGSLVALEGAARHPERVDRIALLGTAFPMAVAGPLLDAARENRHEALDWLNIWGHGPSAHFGGNQQPGMWMMGGYLRLLERAAPGVLHTDLNACNAYGGGLDAAARVRCPALFLLGARDVMAPLRAARALMSAVPDSRSVVIEGCGHALMSERPDRVLDALIEFFG